MQFASFVIHKSCVWLSGWMALSTPPELSWEITTNPTNRFTQSCKGLCVRAIKVVEPNEHISTGCAHLSAEMPKVRCKQKAAEKSKFPKWSTKLRKQARPQEQRKKTEVLTHAAMKSFHPLKESTIELCLWELERRPAHSREYVRCRNTSVFQRSGLTVVYYHRYSREAQATVREQKEINTVHLWLSFSVNLGKSRCSWYRSSCVCLQARLI